MFMLNRGMYKVVIVSDLVQSSLSVNQSTGSLAITKAFGPEVLGVTSCGGREREIKVKELPILFQNFIVAVYWHAGDGSILPIV